MRDGDDMEPTFVQPDEEMACIYGHILGGWLEARERHPGTSIMVPLALLGQIAGGTIANLPEEHRQLARETVIKNLDHSIAMGSVATGETRQ